MNVLLRMFTVIKQNLSTALKGNYFSTGLLPFLLSLTMVMFSVNSTVASSCKLAELLAKHHFKNVLPKRYQQGKVYVLDISKQSKTLNGVDIFSTKALIEHSKKLRKDSGANLVVGRYLEDRAIYQRGKHYNQEGEPRSVHLGQDLMVPANTPVSSPLAAVVHSFKDNKEKADFGPTIILAHQLHGMTFYTLYGHLSRASLNNLSVGKKIRAGEVFSWVGTPKVNGGWPEHLHFQIIDDMRGEKGNFKGVIKPSEVEQYRCHCPNPNLILNIDALK